MNIQKHKAIKIGGIPVDLFEEDDYKALLKAAVSENERKTFFNTNAHLVVLANTKYQWLKEAFAQKVDYVMCDGAGIQLASKLLGKEVPPKIAYNVWFWDFSRFCAQQGYKVFFLGGRKEVVQKAAENMKSASPDLLIQTHHGYFDHKKGSAENSEVIDKINLFAPQVLLVGFGMPLQESWILENKEDLNVNAFFPCGGAFDFFAGVKSTAPAWLRKIKLEWLYRMLLEPRRLGKRYLLENPQFIYFVLKNR